MAMFNSCKQPTHPILYLGFIISIIGGGCATSEKQDNSPEPVPMAEDSVIPTQAENLKAEPQVVEMKDSVSAEDDPESVSSENLAEKTTDEMTQSAPDQGQEPEEIVVETASNEVETVSEMKVSETPADGNQYYILEKGELQKNRAPLPNYIPMVLKLMNGEKVVSQYLAYRAWDFNYDGNVDMVETLAPDGSVTQRSYDFDFDGQFEMEE